MDEQAKWYVIHTYSGYEKTVADNIKKVVENRKLQDLIQDVFIPKELVTVIKSEENTNDTYEGEDQPKKRTRKSKKEEGEKVVERNKFPCYVFVKMVKTPETWYVVRNTRGVTSFVGIGTEPTPLTDDEVAKLGIETKTTEVDYKVGDNVVIVSSETLADMVGRVKAIDLENNCVRIVISMFGRETPVDLELNQVRKVTD